MALKRPEGLSPCYLSLASPDIPESHVFKWTIRGAGSVSTQARFTIKLWDSSNTTVLRTQTVISDVPKMPMADLNYPFVIGETYHWSVVTYGTDLIASPESAHAEFKYDECPIFPLAGWNSTLTQGNIVTRQYLDEIKTNLLLILEDYFVPPSMKVTAQGLFKGNIVPSRLDFKKLEEVLRYLYMKTGIFLEPKPTTRRQELIKEGRLWNWDELNQEEEWAYEEQQIERPIINVQKPIEDSLGISDIQSIRDYLTFLTNTSPKPIQKISIDIPNTAMYEVYDIDAEMIGTHTPVVDIRWKVTPLFKQTGYFVFDSLSTSENIRYYRALFEYGPSDNSFVSEMYFKATDLYDGATRSFETNWEGLYTTETIGFAKQSLQVFAVDHKGNTSPPKTVNNVYGSNFKVPLGIKTFVVQSKKTAAQNSPEWDVVDSWYTIYTGAYANLTHRISGAYGNIYYRVKAIDMSGLESDWVLANEGVPFVFDPTAPPSAPSKLTYTSTTREVTIKWEAPARAEKYEYRLGLDLAPHETVQTQGFLGNWMQPASLYEIYVRAGNPRGWSPWTSIIVRTKSERAVVSLEAIRAKSWNNKNGWEPGHWGYVYQGEDYIGANDPHPYYTGKHKGLWVYNDIYLKDVLAGQRILKTEIWIDSMNNNNSRIPPTFWMHNYAHDKVPTSGEPLFVAPYQPPGKLDTQHIGWITLPNYFGEHIRDGTAKGIGVYADNWSSFPYVKMQPLSKLRITYEDMQN